MDVNLPPRGTAGEERKRKRSGEMGDLIPESPRNHGRRSDSQLGVGAGGLICTAVVQHEETGLPCLVENLNQL